MKGEDCRKVIHLQLAAKTLSVCLFILLPQSLLTIIAGVDLLFRHESELLYAGRGTLTQVACVGVS